jgi:hypothetical protein
MPTMTTKNAVLGLVSTYPQADNLVEALRRAGFATKDISVLFPDIHAALDQYRDASKANGNAVTALAGATRRLTDAGEVSESESASGPMVAALGGPASEKTTPALTMLGISSTEAKRYEAMIKHGYVFVGVRADSADDQKRAKTAYEGAGAQDVEVAAAAS